MSGSPLLVLMLQAPALTPGVARNVLPRSGPTEFKCLAVRFGIRILGHDAPHKVHHRDAAVFIGNLQFQV